MKNKEIIEELTRIKKMRIIQIKNNLILEMRMYKYIN